MKLSPEQKEAVLKQIQESIGGEAKCNLCGSHEWLVSDIVFQLSEFAGGTGGFMLIGGAVVPVIPMTCAKCSNTLLLNAVVLGVVAPAEPQPSPAGAGESVESPGSVQ